VLIMAPNIKIISPQDNFFGRGLSARDQSILVTLRRNLSATADFREALQTLQEAVEEYIPAGRTYLLGSTPFGPIVGSILSGVGIVDGSGGALIVRVERTGRILTLSKLL
jgi:hypothetical protein